MEEGHSIIPSSLNNPGDLADQVVIPVSKACFRDLDNLMGEGDWVTGLLSSYLAQDQPYPHGNRSSISATELKTLPRPRIYKRITCSRRDSPFRRVRKF